MSVSTTVNAWFYRQMAIWAGLLKRDELSLEYWERVRELRPRDAATALTVAHRRAERGEHRQAVALVEKAIEIDPQRASAWFNLGFLLQQLGEHADALRAFERAVALDPKLDRAWYGSALSLIKLGRIEEAIAPLKKNTELQPMSPYGYYQLAHAWNQLGKRQNAIATIRHLSRFEPKVAKQLEREIGVDAGVPDPYEFTTRGGYHLKRRAEMKQEGKNLEEGPCS